MDEHKNQILVVEDDASVRRAIQRLLKGAGLESQGFESAEDFFELAESSMAACVLIDLNLPGVDGLGIQTWLADSGHELPIVFMTGKGDVTSTATGMKQGAVDFLAKPFEDEVLLAAVQQAVDRGRRMKAARDERLILEDRLRTLTPREREVLEQIKTGRQNKLIAYELGIVEKTVKVHRGRVMEKMEASTLAELLRFCTKLDTTA